jgi:hypothetical protein
MRASARTSGAPQVHPRPRSFCLATLLIARANPCHVCSTLEGHYQGYQGGPAAKAESSVPVDQRETRPWFWRGPQSFRLKHVPPFSLPRVTGRSAVFLMDVNGARCAIARPIGGGADSFTRARAARNYFQNQRRDDRFIYVRIMALLVDYSNLACELRILLGSL